MCGEAGLVNAGRNHRALERTLKGLVVHVVAPHDTGPRISGVRGLREYPEPGPRGAGPRVLPFQRVWHLHARPTFCMVCRPECVCMRELQLQAHLEGCGHHERPVLPTLALSHDDGLVGEVQILHTQL